MSNNSMADTIKQFDDTKVIEWMADIITQTTLKAQYETDRPLTRFQNLRREFNEELNDEPTVDGLLDCFFDLYNEDKLDELITELEWSTTEKIHMLQFSENREYPWVERRPFQAHVDFSDDLTSIQFHFTIAVDITDEEQEQLRNILFAPCEIGPCGPGSI